MANDVRPAWQIELLWYESWTRHQFISALCGEDPDAAEISTDDWSAEQHRAAAHVDAAIRAGELTVVFTTAAAMDDPYGNYEIRPDVAIRWATKRPGRFPLFPFVLDDLRSHASVDIPSAQVEHATGDLGATGTNAPIAAGAGSVVETQAKLVERRAKLLAEYMNATGVKKHQPIYEDSRSGIYKPQFYEWRNGVLPATSRTAINFERFLRGKKAPWIPD